MRRAQRGHLVVSATLAASCVAAVGAAGCGGQEARKNTDRPAAPIVVTALISKDKVSVSPAHFGAGPITLIVTNQTDRSQQITLETSDEPGSSKTGVRQETGPINPRDTAKLMADVDEGSYSVHVSGDGIRPAKLAVGHARATSQQDLLLP